MLLVFHHINVHQLLLVAGYVLVDNVTVDPLSLYIGDVVVLHPFSVALNVNEFTATVFTLLQSHQFHNMSCALTFQ